MGSEAGALLRNKNETSNHIFDVKCQLMLTLRKFAIKHSTVSHAK